MLEIVIGLLACGCSFVTVHSVPNQRAPDNAEVFNARLEGGGAWFYLMPVNSLTLREPWWVREKDRESFNRLYYYPPKPNAIPYFLVELLVDPSDTTGLTLDIAAVKLKHDGQQISPVAFWRGKEHAWHRKKSKAEYLHGPLCSVVEPYRKELYFLDEMQHINRGRALDLDPESPTCFILKFPIPPIDPRTPFSIELSHIASRDGKPISLATTNYRAVQTKSTPLPGP